MDRREFLQLTAAALGMVLIPESFAGDNEIRNVSDLTKYIEDRYKCSVGSPGPFITEEMNLKPGFWGSFPKEMRYSVICFVMDEKDPVQAEKTLCQYAKNEFSKIPSTEIIWRVKPEFESMKHYEFGEKLASWAEIEDGKPVPENAAYDPVTESYRVVLNTYNIHRVRMRLAVPAAHDQFKHLFMQEGSGRAIRI